VKIQPFSRLEAEQKLNAIRYGNRNRIGTEQKGAMIEGAPKFPNHVKAEIKRRGYKLYEVAKALYISERTLYTYCIGQRPIPRDTLERLAALLECPIPILVDERASGTFSGSPQSSSQAQPGRFSHEPSEYHLPETSLACPEAHDIISTEPYKELETLDIIRSRRQALQDILGLACTALTLSPYTLLSPERGERLTQAVIAPSRVDADVVSDLACITERYWRLCANSSLDLLSGISGHFSTSIQLLKDSHPTPIYRQLCSLAGENAQILGKTLFDMREYTLAWAYYVYSVKAAQEAHNADLWAVGLGRMALLLIYYGQTPQALPLVQEAQQADIQQACIRSWLAAVEAEVHARLGNDDACRWALDVSKSITASTPFGDDSYFTGFNPSRQSGYEGACFMRLQQPQRALPALQDALNQLEPSAIRRRSTLLTDIGAAYAQLGDVQSACTSLGQALAITAQLTRSLSTLQRIASVRDRLMPWKESPYVKEIDEQFAQTVITLRTIREMI
jgi:tetratricopeptide (TPR) repeat protein/transcriptional regulator with XRE-family HTH domain